MTARSSRCIQGRMGAAVHIETALARTRLHLAVRRFFDEFDVLLGPTTQVLPFDASLRYPAEVAGVAMTTYIEWMRSVCVISATGCPAISRRASRWVCNSSPQTARMSYCSGWPRRTTG